MRRFVFIVAIAVQFLLVGSGNVTGATNYFIEQIDISSDAHQNIIQLSLNKSFTDVPILEYETGLASITFQNTDFDPALSRVTVNNRFIQVISLGRDMKNTVMNIQFADVGFQPVGLISYKTDGQRFVVLAQKKKGEGGFEEEPVAQTESEFLGREESAGLDSYFTKSSFTQSMVKSVVALLVLLVLIYAVIWIFKRVFSTRFRISDGNYKIKVSATYHISPKQKIIVVEINEMAFALGVTPDNISLISRVSSSTLAETIQQMELPAKRDVDFAELRKQYLMKKRQKEESEIPEQTSPQNFATELISRVKKLRPLD